jgi:hypothetical protein
MLQLPQTGDESLSDATSRSQQPKKKKRNNKNKNRNRKLRQKEQQHLLLGPASESSKQQVGMDLVRSEVVRSEGGRPNRTRSPLDVAVLKSALSTLRGPIDVDVDDGTIDAVQAELMRAIGMPEDEMAREQGVTPPDIAGGDGDDEVD